MIFAISFRARAAFAAIISYILIFSADVFADDVLLI